MEASSKKHDICGSKVKGGIRHIVLHPHLGFDAPNSASAYISSLVNSLAAHSFFLPVYLPPRLQARSLHLDLRNAHRTLDRYRNILVVSSRFRLFVSERSPHLFVSESHFHLGSADFSWFLVRITDITLMLLGL